MWCASNIGSLIFFIDTLAFYYWKQTNFIEFCNKKKLKSAKKKKNCIDIGRYCWNFYWNVNVEMSTSEIRLICSFQKNRSLKEFVFINHTNVTLSMTIKCRWYIFFSFFTAEYQIVLYIEIEFIFRIKSNPLAKEKTIKACQWESYHDKFML